MSSKTSHAAPAGLPNPLLAEVRQLIVAARQRLASAVNAELTQLYWHIGRRISAELLQGQRGEYGKEVVAELARQLTADFGKGWSEQQLRHCLRLADTFPDEQILSTVRRELSWSHLKALIYIDDPLKRDFYIEICRVERWSVRQLQEHINSLLFVTEMGLTERGGSPIYKHMTRQALSNHPENHFLAAESGLHREYTSYQNE